MTTDDTQCAHQAVELLAKADDLLQEMNLPLDEAALDLYHEVMFDLTECREKLARLLVKASLAA